MLDIGIDLPPPGMRRSQQPMHPQPIYDMGPLLLGVQNGAQMEERAVRSSVLQDGPARPPTQVVGLTDSWLCCRLGGETKIEGLKEVSVAACSQSQS